MSFKDLTAALNMDTLDSILEWVVKNSEDLTQESIDFVTFMYKNGFSRLKDFKLGATFGGENVGGYWTVVSEPGVLEVKSVFQPNLTPDQMLRYGVFGGKYIESFYKDLPIEWILLALVADKLRPLSKNPDPSVNRYKIISHQSLSEWQEKGWLHPQDPMGWFQWYIRYYLGRRTDNDEEQIKRWNRFRRNVTQIQNNPDDDTSKQRRQSCLQWAYNPNKKL
jgi:hypothetical protein